MNSKKMQTQLTQPVVRFTRRPRLVIIHTPPANAIGSDFPNDNAKTAYAAFFALSALRSRLLLAASGPLSVSRAQSHHVKELE